MSVEVKLIVIPDDVDPSDVLDTAVYGKNMSTSEQIVVNKAKFGYTVIYSESDFVAMRMPNLVASLIQVFSTNVPNQMLIFSIMHELDEDENGGIPISATTRQLFILNGLFKDVVSRTNPDGSKICPNIGYHITAQINDIIYMYTHAYGATVDDVMFFRNGNLGTEDAPEFDDDSDYDEEDEDENESEDPFEAFYGLKKRKEEPKKEFYGRSRIFKESKSPRKEIRRHGVLIAQSKGDIKRDEKIIKDFLKDFIPGKADWKKDFRNELAKRWISVYTVSKKKLKTMEKEYRHSVTNKRKSKETKKVLKFANKLFTVPVDRWNDPSK